MRAIFLGLVLAGLSATALGDGLVAFSNNGSTLVKVKGLDEPDTAAVPAAIYSLTLEIIWAPSGTPYGTWTGHQKLSTWLGANPGWQELAGSRTSIQPTSGRFNGGGVVVPTTVHGAAIDIIVIGWDATAESFDDACLQNKAVGFSAKFGVVTANPFAVPPPLPTSILGADKFQGLILSPILLDPENRAPILPFLPDRVEVEETVIMFSVAGTDPDAGQSITYELGSAAPPGISLNPNTGAFMWTPSEASGPGQYLITVIARDNGTPVLSSGRAFTIFVEEANRAPGFSGPSGVSAEELSAVSIQLVATDPDLPANTLVFEKQTGPSALQITPSGRLEWTPGEAEGPGSYEVTFRVRDNGFPEMSTTATVTVNVAEVNASPQMASIPDQAVEELTSLNLVASATDSDVPPNTLLFTKVTGPASLTVSPSGAVLWNPDEQDGPGVFPVIVEVTDSGSPAKKSSVSFSVTVTEANVPPVLSLAESHTVSELSELSFIAAATDSDVPPNTLTYYKVSGPGDLSVSSSGLVSWTPTESDGPGRYSAVIGVSDGHTNVTQEFALLVNETNAAPVLAAIGNKAVSEGVTLAFSALATDSDIPSQSVTFSLAGGAPSGASISPTGEFSWVPTEEQGPGVYPVTILVTDGTETDEETIQIMVDELNSPPVLAAIGNKVVEAGTALVFTNSAVDSDLPAQQLHFSLAPGAPAGAAVSSDGIFTWTPDTTQGGSTYPVSITVSDGISDVSETIQVQVSANLALSITTPPQDQSVLAGAPAAFSVSAVGQAPIYFQWRFNGMDLGGATESTLTIPNVQPGNVGNYDVVVSNASTVLVSSAAALTIEQALSGVGIDGYIAGGTVFFDANLNGVRDANEPSTETDGAGMFDLTVNMSLFDLNQNGRLDPTEGRLVLKGGFDIATGLPHKTFLLAPAGSTVLTPLTTLLQTMIQQDMVSGPEETELKLKASLGITSDLSLTQFDPLLGAVTNAPGALSLLKAAAQVQDTFVQVAAIVSESTNSPAGSDSAAQAVMDVLGSLMLSGDSTDLSSSSFVTQVITQSVAVAGSELPPDVVSGAAEIISELNELKAAIDGTPGGGVEAAKLLAQVQSVAQGVVRQSLEEVVQARHTIDDLKAGYTGENLSNTLASAAVGDLLGTEDRSGHFSFTRQQCRIKEDGSMIPGAEVVLGRFEGTKGAVTLRLSCSDGTASFEEGDYHDAPVMVNFADGEVTKVVSLENLVRDDDLVEGDETISLSLSLGPNPPDGTSIGLAGTATLVVVDNDNPGSFSFAKGDYRLNESAAGLPVSITRSGGHGGTVTVIVTPTAVPGGATAGVDFLAAPFEIQFLPGNMNRTFTLPVLPDHILEGEERLELVMELAPGAPLGAQLGVISRAAVVVEDDPSRTPQALIEILGRTGENQRQLRIRGTGGQKFIVQSSSDLQQWTELQGGVLATEPLDINVAAPVDSSRFYRVQLVK